MKDKKSKPNATHGDRTKISSRPFRRGGNGGIRVPADARGWCPVMAPGYVLCASF